MGKTITKFCDDWNRGSSDIKITPFETAGDVYWAEIRFPKQNYYCENDEDFFDLEDRIDAKSGGTVSVETSYCDFNDGILSLGIYSSNTGGDAIRVVETLKELLDERIPDFKV